MTVFAKAQCGTMGHPGDPTADPPIDPVDPCPNFGQMFESPCTLMTPSNDIEYEDGAWQFPTMVCGHCLQNMQVYAFRSDA